MENTNTPTQGTEADTYETRLKAWEGEKRGILKDLQGERDKRHQLEQRLEQIESTLTSAEVVPEDVQAKVQKLSMDPDNYIREIVLREISPIRKTTEDLVIKDQYDKAYRWLAKKEGKDVDEIVGSKLEEELARIVKDRGMAAMDPVNGTKAAYDILKKEEKEKEKREAEREEAIAGESAERVTIPPRQGQTRFTRADIAAMSRQEFERNREAILEAQSKGLIN